MSAWRNYGLVSCSRPTDFDCRNYFRRSGTQCSIVNIYVYGGGVFFHSLWSKENFLECIAGTILLFFNRIMFKKMTEFGPDSGGRVKV